MKSAKLSNAVLLLASSIFALSGGAMTGSAEANYYIVAQRIGAGFVFGSLTTDGRMGVLDTSDFKAWSLELIRVGARYHISSTDAEAFVLDVGSDVTAAGDVIRFNFSRNDGGYLLFQDDAFTGLHYWCNSAGSSACLPGKTVSPQFIFDGTAVNVPASGNPIIAYSVPEPSSWALMLLGFAGWASRRNAVGAGTRSRHCESSRKKRLNIARMADCLRPRRAGGL